MPGSGRFRTCAVRARELKQAAAVDGEKEQETGSSPSTVLPDACIGQAIFKNRDPE